MGAAWLAARVGVLLMGVAGSGKSTVAAELARRRRTGFLDADAVHDAEAVDRMRRGQRLLPAQRDAWIVRLVTALLTHPDAVVACSALKRAHRDRLRAAGAHPIVWLAVPTDELERRLAQRRGHAVTVSLLASQLDDLETPSPAEGVIRVDGSQPLTHVLDDVEGVLDELV